MSDHPVAELFQVMVYRFIHRIKQLHRRATMGITLLYVGGSILVLAAAILLITKRRMNAED